MKKNKNILFVDDEPAILEIYQSLFSNRSSNIINSIEERLQKLSTTKMVIECRESDINDMRIFTANQGRTAIEMVLERKQMHDPIQVVFVDMRMPPGINGEETIKEIANIDQDIQIVLVTAYSDVKLQMVNQIINIPERLLFLKKPFDNEEIIQLVRNLTTKYMAQRAQENLMASISHELKTPVAIIKGYAEILQDSLIGDEEKIEMIIKIKENAIQLNDDISDLLHLVQGSTKAS